MMARAILTVNRTCCTVEQSRKKIKATRSPPPKKIKTTCSPPPKKIKATKQQHTQCWIRYHYPPTHHHHPHLCLACCCCTHHHKCCCCCCCLNNCYFNNYYKQLFTKISTIFAGFVPKIAIQPDLSLKYLFTNLLPAAAVKKPRCLI